MRQPDIPERATAARRRRAGDHPVAPGRMVPLARRYLLTEPLRFAMSIAGVGFAVLLVLVVLGLYRGWGASTSFFGELPGDLWVAQDGTSDPLRSSSFVPDGAADELSRIPGVVATLPVHSRRVAVDGMDRALSAHLMSFDVPPTIPMPTEARDRFLPDPGHIVVDRVFADDAGVEVGDPMRVLDRTLVVERIVSGGNPLFAIVFMNSEDARELLALDGYVNFYVLLLAPDAVADDVSSAATAAVANVEVRSSGEYAATMAATVDEGFLPVVGALVAIGFTIGGAVVALTTYTATIEKARDFAVMKALGASGWFVYRVVIRQSAIIGVSGSVLGLLSAVFVARFVRRLVPEFLTEIRWSDATAVLALTVAVSLVAAYVPVRRIERIDPAMVFRA